MSRKPTGGLQSRRCGRCGGGTLLDLSDDTRNGKDRSRCRRIILWVGTQIELESLTVESHGWISKGTRREVKVKPSKDAGKWDALKMEKNVAESSMRLKS